MEPFQIKILCAVSLWTISVTFGVLLPYFLWSISPKRPQDLSYRNQEDSSENDESDDNLISDRRRYLQQPRFFSFKLFVSNLRVKLADGQVSSVVYCLCGGVFLGVSFLDLIPQSRTAVGAVLDQSKIITSYPVAEFMIVFGLLLVMTIESVVSESVLVTKSRNAVSNLPFSESFENSSDDVSADEILGDSTQIRQNVSQYRMYILVVTLSLHSVFEGLAIGLQKDLSTLVQLVVAVSVHKAVLSFSIGLPLFETLGNFRRVSVAIVCTMIFCCASPAGCLTGAFISGGSLHASPSGLLASAILQCLATGTFLYVTFVEVIPREFSHHAREHKEKSESNSRNISLDNNAYDANCPTMIGLEDRECRIRKKRREEHQSQLIKLLALIAGFAVASSLQFL